MDPSPPTRGSPTSEVDANGGVLPGSTGDHVALVVSDGEELQTFPLGNGSHSRGSGATAEGSVARPTSEGDADLKAGKVENLAEWEVRSLLWLEEPENRVLAKAHAAWEAKDALFASRIDKKKKQSNSLRNEIYQLIGYYSVFQGVLLTAVAQSNLLHCHNWWTAFSLSFLASVVGLGGVLQKFLAIIALELTIKNEELTRKECIIRVAKLKQKRQAFDFETDAKDGAQGKKFDLRRLKGSIVVVLVSLVFFSGLFLASIHRILCDPGDSCSSPGPSQASS